MSDEPKYTEVTDIKVLDLSLNGRSARISFQTPEGARYFEFQTEALRDLSVALGAVWEAALVNAAIDVRGQSLPPRLNMPLLYSVRDAILSIYPDAVSLRFGSSEDSVQIKISGPALNALKLAICLGVHGEH